MYGVYTEYSSIQFRRCCNECLRRKVRCDGQRPCTNCQRRHHDCQYSLIRRKPPTPSYRTTAPRPAPPPVSAPAAVPTVRLSPPPPARARASPPSPILSTPSSTSSLPTPSSPIVHPAAEPTSLSVSLASSVIGQLPSVLQRLSAIMDQCEQIVACQAAYVPPSPLHWLSGPDAILTGIPDDDAFVHCPSGFLDVNQVWTMTASTASDPDPDPSSDGDHPWCPADRRVPPRAAPPPRTPLLIEPVSSDFYLYHPSVIHSLVNLYFTRSGCLCAEAQQTRFLRLLFAGRVSPLLRDAMLCIAARFSHHPHVQRRPAYLSAQPYFEHAERATLGTLESPSLDGVVAFHLLTAWAVGQSDLARLITYSGLSSRLSTALDLHATDAPRRLATPVVAHADRSRIAAVYTNVCRQVFWSIASTDFASAMFSSTAPVTDVEAIAVQPPDEAILAALLDPDAAMYDADRRLPAIIPPSFITSHVSNHFAALSRLIGRVATFRAQAAAGRDTTECLLRLNRELSEWYGALPASVVLPPPHVPDDTLFRRALDVLQLLQFHARYQTAVILLNTRDPQGEAAQAVGPRLLTVSRTVAWQAAEWVCNQILPLARRFRVEFHGPMTGGYLYYASWVYITELLAHPPTTPALTPAPAAGPGPGGGSSVGSTPVRRRRAPPPSADASPPIESFGSIHTPLILSDRFRQSPPSGPASSSPPPQPTPEPLRGPSASLGAPPSSSPRPPSPDRSQQDPYYCVRQLHEIYVQCQLHTAYWAYNRLVCTFIRQQVARASVVTEDQRDLFFR
ncbi:hypothetical protein IWQ60_008536 [Tieghemiomyces parasiticus]|uniref:Zn(2)-C6 fungal-type domain-containing protein n=1 Tax=Tieghemiomyces parasiticus TaxID=78921 RepID=A0A9W8A149_9FUNG|nr:hypothetical protein IWQ60_008536 [Tieghemiomyces parasiticus]